MSESDQMCPHCGDRFTLKATLPTRLIPTHPDWEFSTRACKGSDQNPRNPFSDRRPLWNGDPNPHATS